MKTLYTALLLFVFNPSLAAPTSSGDWHFDFTDDGFAYAATTNADGRVLGQYCYYTSESCYYVTALGITCTEDREFPSIINSNNGVADITMVCGPETNQGNLLFIKPFADIDRIVRKADRVGFAVAMDGGTFKVVRFSLSGSSNAIERMRKGTEELLDRNKPEVLEKKDELYL